MRSSIRSAMLFSSTRGCLSGHSSSSASSLHILIKYVIIPREAEGYSVELFGLSVRPSVPWPRRGPLRHVCGHTNHRTTMVHTIFGKSKMGIPGFVFGYSKKINRNWRLKAHYMAMSYSRRGPLRHVCGQTIYPTAMIIPVKRGDIVLNFSVCPSVCLPPLERSIASRLRPHQSLHNDDSCIFGKPK